MRQALSSSSLAITAALTALLFATAWMTTPVFFQHLITGKQWGVEQVVLLVAAFLVISLPFFRDLRISFVDVGIFLLLSWWILGETLLQETWISQETMFFHLALWGTVYLFVRSTSHDSRMAWTTVVVLLITALSLSILGLMQLYGFEASHHGLFKITGTFHNPGPFSGFVVSALPLALFCYTTCPERSGEKHGGDTERHREKDTREISIKWLNASFPVNNILPQAIKWLSLLTIMAILLIIPAAQSRAAWVAGAAGCLFVFLAHPATISFRDKLKTSFKRLSFWARMSIITGIVIGIIGAGAGLYLMKKDSANGRLLIWQVTGQLIKDQPVAGHGTGAFEALYMDEQAHWFKSGKGTEAQAMVAGSPEAPFNEPLKLWLEKGLIGVLLAGGILGLILFPKTLNSNSTRNSELTTKNSERITPHPTPPNPLKGEPQPRNHSTQNQLETRNTKLGTLNAEPKTQNAEPSTRNSKNETRNSKHGTRNSEHETLTSGLKGTLIALLTFSLFSYPFDISSFTLQLVVVVALLSSTTPALLTIKGRNSLLLTIPIVVLLIAAGAWYFPKRQAHYDALKTWHEAEQFYNMRSYDIAAEEYKEAFPTLKNNGLFLQMYGKALSMDEQHEKSNEILQRATQRFSSYILHNTIGDNNKALGNFKKAETAYKKSTNMVPGLLLPKYLLAKLYVKSDQTRKAKQTAKKILNSPVKVESSATREIMEEMKKILTRNKTRTFFRDENVKTHGRASQQVTHKP